MTGCAEFDGFAFGLVQRTAVSSALRQLHGRTLLQRRTSARATLASGTLTVTSPVP